MTRGYRNNNPLNIVKSNSKWQGMSTVQNDKRFVTFVSMDYGYRAAIKLLFGYQSRYGLKTIEQMVSRWAPHFENDTNAYVDTVSKRTGIPKSEIVDLRKDEKSCIRIVEAMSFVENGCAGDMATIQKAYKMAL